MQRSKKIERGQILHSTVWHLRIFVMLQLKSLKYICWCTTILFPWFISHHNIILFFASQLQTFNTPAPCQTVEELTTGAAMSQALHQM